MAFYDSTATDPQAGTANPWSDSAYNLLVSSVQSAGQGLSLVNSLGGTARYYQQAETFCNTWSAQDTTVGFTCTASNIPSYW